MTAASPPNAQGRIAELDALRGLAALAVVLFHYTTRYDAVYGFETPLPFALPWGDSGIHLFFAISGFVICMTLARTRTLADFVASRFSRLFPAYWAAIAITTFVVAGTGAAHLAVPVEVVALNLTMAHTILGVPSVDAVYWTLAVELAFYIAMAAIWRLGLLPRIELVLLGWMTTKWLWSFAPQLFGFELSYIVGALLVQQYIPFFAIGIAAYRLRDDPSHPCWPLAVVTAALATVAICDGAGYALAALVAAAAVLIVAAGGTPLLRLSPLTWLGTISYSLYLLHQNIGYLILARLESAGVSPGPAVAVAVVAALLLAALVTYTIEQPALRWLRGAYKRRALATADAGPAKLTA